MIPVFHFLAQALRDDGFTDVLVRSTSPSSAEAPSKGSILRRLQNQHVVIKRTFVELIIDIGFRAHFELPGLASAPYSAMLSSVPPIFVGGRMELEELVAQIAILMARVYLDAGLAVPPWRSLEALLSRWPRQQDGSGPRRESWGSDARSDDGSDGGSSVGGFSPTGMFASRQSSSGHLGLPAKVVFGFDVKPTAVKVAEEVAVEPALAPAAMVAVAPAVEPAVVVAVEPAVMVAVEPAVEPAVVVAAEPAVELAVMVAVEPAVEPVVKPAVEPAVPNSPMVAEELQPAFASLPQASIPPQPAVVPHHLAEAEQPVNAAAARLRADFRDLRPQPDVRADQYRKSPDQQDSVAKVRAVQTDLHFLKASSGRNAATPQKSFAVFNLRKVRLLSSGI